MFWNLFGETEDYQKFVKKAIKEHLYEILGEEREIEVEKIYKKMIHRENLYLAHMLRIEAILEQLEEKGIIELEGRKVKENEMTLLDCEGWRTVPVREFYRRREKEEEIKEILRVFTQSALEELV
ncbi:MAG: hypothetical protein ACTSQE_01145 [Candidatus Heimdallarchaeaceae archaeon]